MDIVGSPRASAAGADTSGSMWRSMAVLVKELHCSELAFVLQTSKHRGLPRKPSVCSKVGLSEIDAPIFSHFQLLSKKNVPAAHFFSFSLMEVVFGGGRIIWILFSTEFGFYALEFIIWILTLGFYAWIFYWEAAFPQPTPLQS